MLIEIVAYQVCVREEESVEVGRQQRTCESGEKRECGRGGRRDQPKVCKEIRKKNCSTLLENLYSVVQCVSVCFIIIFECLLPDLFTNFWLERESL